MTDYRGSLPTGHRFHHAGVPVDVRLPGMRCRPHLCFEVDGLDEALAGRELLLTPTNPSSELRVAFIVFEGAPIELLQVL